MRKKLLETNPEIIQGTNVEAFSQEEIDNMERYKRLLENIAKLPPIGIELTEVFVKGINVGVNMKQTA